MTRLERGLYRFLLVVDLCAILISMVAGPLMHTTIAISAAACAGVISLCLVVYTIYFWPNRRQ